MKSKLEAGMVFVDDHHVQFAVLAVGNPFCFIRNLQTGTEGKFYSISLQHFKLVGRNYEAKRYPKVKASE